jgi:gluconolactonase
MLINNAVMKKIPVIAVLIYASIAANCGSENNKTEETKTLSKDSAVGKVELYNKNAFNLIDTNTAIEVIGKNYTWSEGPVWVADKQMLLFSDVPENKIYVWKNGDTAKLWLTPSGYTDTAFREGENGSNGLTLDKNGKLLLCQSGNRQVARLNTSFDDPKPLFTVLAATYKGKRFNSPNDLVTDSKNNIYFTDPIYGLPKGADDPERELNFEGVYKIAADGTLWLLIDSIPRPNGVALSLDEKTLYIASSDADKPAWYAYTLDENGNIKNGGLLLDAKPLKEKAAVKQGPDGFKIDKYGDIFSAGPDGINIISPAGELLGLIKIYNRRVSNCAFNETKDVLFITADDVALKMRLHK